MQPCYADMCWQWQNCTDEHIILHQSGLATKDDTLTLISAKLQSINAWMTVTSMDHRTTAYLAEVSCNTFRYIWAENWPQLQ